jgi:phage tail-like protein
MARSISTDPLLTCNFALVDVPFAGIPPVVFTQKLVRSALSGGVYIGLQGISVPVQQLATREIREGNHPYTHQVHTGQLSGGECVLRQAVLGTHLDMFLWWQQAIWGRVGPRRHFAVIHLRQDKTLPSRILLLENCIPISWQPASDFDAESAQVSLETMTLSVEDVLVLPLPPLSGDVGAGLIG